MAGAVDILLDYLQLIALVGDQIVSLPFDNERI